MSASNLFLTSRANPDFDEALPVSELDNPKLIRGCTTSSKVVEWTKGKAIEENYESEDDGDGDGDDDDDEEYEYDDEGDYKNENEYEDDSDENREGGEEEENGNENRGWYAYNVGNNGQIEELLEILENDGPWEKEELDRHEYFSAGLLEVFEEDEYVENPGPTLIVLRAKG
ncbi:hypothetical protein K458DRAFT_388878 [Lentithecium fluviatile CBS 122367]|uniref:Uncharacterized protein n=1 Tax=Lentithecium fluviatile CBS 122367 TaxID=1168545 RepID=A0A6G1J2E7_9PLEO|nr:hypothetical protein K458DRAFT_388878 [Lentithecium fluviatile CBS 122367]